MGGEHAPQPERADAPTFRSGDRSKLIGARRFRSPQLCTRQEAEHRYHPGGRPRLYRCELLRPARLHNAERGPSVDRGVEVHAELLEFCKLLADEHRVDYRALSDTSSGGTRGAHLLRNAERHRPAVKPSNPSLTAQEGRLL